MLLLLNQIEIQKKATMNFRDPYGDQKNARVFDVAQKLWLEISF